MARSRASKRNLKRFRNRIRRGDLPAYTQHKPTRNRWKRAIEWLRGEPVDVFTESEAT